MCYVRPLYLPSPSCFADQNGFSRWIRLPAVLQTALSVIPRSRIGRSSTLLPTEGDQVRGTIEGPLTSLPPLRPVGPTSVGTTREEGDGLRRIHVDSRTTHRDPQVCDGGDETPEGGEGGYGGGLACQVFIGD